MAIDDPSRRQALRHVSRGFLTAATAGVAVRPVWSKTPASGPRLAAAWATDAGHQLGVLQIGGSRLEVVSRLDVPTRAHGLSRESVDVMLSVARRPGDWLLRWRTDGRPLTWCWIEPGRAFNGHALHSPDGLRLYTTETDLETGQGWIGVRDRRSLRKLDEWPTAGRDPHQIAWLPGAEGRRLIVVNGGIATLPETGRIKLDLDRMDSSLAVLDTERGRLHGQWRLPDRRLSLRHLAWHLQGPRPLLGIALQAEHDDPSARARAPVLALWDGAGLRTAEVHDRLLAGYGGDVAVIPEGFAVSAPKADTVGLWRPDGSWIGALDAVQACALADDAGRLWIGARQGAWERTPETLTSGGSTTLRLDNHWVPL